MVYFDCPCCDQRIRARASLAGHYVLCAACGKPSRVPVARTDDNNAVFAATDGGRERASRLTLAQLLLTVVGVALVALAPVKALQVQARQQELAAFGARALELGLALTRQLHESQTFEEYDRDVAVVRTALARLAADAPEGALRARTWQLVQQAFGEYQLARDIWAEERGWLKLHPGQQEMPLRSALRRRFTEHHGQLVRSRHAKRACWAAAGDHLAEALDAR